MTEQTKVPAIRFAGFTDPWEQRKLGEFSKKNTIKNANGALSETFTNSAEQGVISQLDYFDHDITNDANISGYYVVQPDDFVYNPRISATAPCGPINRNRLNRAGVMSPLYTVFSVDASMDKTYLEHYFKTSRWHDFMFLEGNTGARSDRFSISDATFFEMPIWCPEISEQMAIAKQLETTDTLITLHQRKYDKLVVFKKSMLEKMFPKDGESVPEIRFAGFTDPWEQRKLGEIASFSKGSGYSKADIRESGIPLFLYGRMYTQYETRVDSVDTFAAPRPGTLYSKGTEIVVPASGESAEDIARASAITREGIALGGDLNVVYPQRMVTPLFLAYGLSHGSSQKMLAQKAQGKTVVHIHASDLKGLGIAFPDVTEQQAIGTFFSSLDDLITLHQRKLELLQNIKKSLLDKMFV